MNNPKLIIIGGFAGAGKTTVATKISGKYNYPVFSSDVLNDALRKPLDKDFHTVSPIAYEVMWYLIRRQLATGVTVIMDTHMSAPRVWESFDALKKDMPSVKILPIILQASLDTHRKRIKERGHNNKEHLNLGGDKLEDVMFKYEFIENLRRPDLIRVDANGTPEDTQQSVETLINKA